MAEVEETEIDVSAEVHRVTAALRSAIRLSGVSHRHIERTLYLSTGYLTRILAGQVELRMRLVLGVCRVIGVPPGNFFAALFPPGQRGEGHDALQVVRKFRAFLEHLTALLEAGQETRK